MKDQIQKAPHRFFISLACALGLISILTFVFLVVPIRNKNRAIAIQTATESNQVVNQILDQHFVSLEKYVEAYAQQAELRSSVEAQNWPALSETLAKLVKNNNQIEISFISDASGTNRVGFPADQSVVGKNFAFRQWYKAVNEQGRTIVSEVYRTASFPRPQVVAISTPILSQDQKVLAYLTSLVKVETMAGWIQEKLPHRELGLSIFDQVGNLVALTQNGSAEIRNLSLHPVIKKALRGQSGIFDGADPVSGIMSLMSYSSVPNTKWNVVVSRPKSEAYAQFLSVLKTLLSSFCFLMFLTIVGYFFWRDQKSSTEVSIETRAV